MMLEGDNKRKQLYQPVIFFCQRAISGPDVHHMGSLILCALVLAVSCVRGRQAGDD